MVRVKICGITNLEDALAAAEAGADAVGLVFAPSPRRVDPETARRIVAALPPMVMAVGVFADQPPAYVCQVRGYCGLHAVQLHGREDPLQVRELGRGVIKALATDPTHPPQPDAYPQATLLLDAHHPQARGGTGTTCDWNLARSLARRQDVGSAAPPGPGPGCSPYSGRFSWLSPFQQYLSG